MIYYKSCAVATVLSICAAPVFAQNVLLERDFWNASPDVAAVEAAVEAGADPLAVDGEDYYPLWRALQAGTSTDVVSYFIDKGEDVNQVGNDNLSAFMMAARFNSLEVVEMFLEREDLEIDYQDDSWRDALGFACLLQTEIPVYEALMAADLPISARDIHGRNCALSAAYLNPNVDTIMWIAEHDDIQAFDNNGTNAFLQAAFRNPSLEVITAMKDVVEDPMAVNKDGNNALTISAIRQKNPAIQSWLLSQGFDVNATNEAGQTALHIAAAGNVLAVVEVLLEAGADVSLTDAEGQSALDLAKAREDGADIVTALTAAGAN
ncbi:ankyrin repeat domain-containing protein [Mangrovicoccus sp. HB161399]|uniref:ankyrin repeat domain-containing protein n=1 Tax=Mangrovicoccus sp. HB161399 TaxID=2720392 RepID=UPI0015568F7C|nr:ankyrin repeat domain-containing protein [Mangrovicoccus sp. HB161399]